MEKEKIIDCISSIAYWFISSAFIMWGWNTLAPHINCPCSPIGKFSQSEWV